MIEKFEIANKQSTDFFANAIKDSGNDIHKMVGQSEYSHLKRFEEMLKLGEFNGKTILDIGCGTAEYYNFLQKLNIDVEYYGTDISEDMISVAKKMNPKIAQNLFVHDIISNNLDRTFDYIICIGIINLDFEGKLNIEMTEQLLSQLDKYSNIGFAISMTSSLSKNPTKGTYYYKASEIIDFVSKIINNFTISHSYLPHDFTLFCYKHQF